MQIHVDVLYRLKVMAFWLSIALLPYLMSPTQEFTAQDRYGKTIEEVLAMGRRPWHDWYTDEARAGSSTAGESFAEMIFADCLKSKNDSFLKLDRTERTALILDVRDSLGKISAECIEAGRGLTGGGTMWNIVGSGVQADIQEAVRDLIWPPKKQSRCSQSAVWASWNKAMKSITDNKSEIESMAMSGVATYPDCVSALNNAKEQIARLATRIKPEQAPFKARVFSSIASYLDLVRLGV